LRLDVTSDPGPNSTDITFSELPPINSSIPVETITGVTKQAEDTRYETLLNVAVMYSIVRIN